MSPRSSLTTKVLPSRILTCLPSTAINSCRRGRRLGPPGKCWMRAAGRRRPAHQGAAQRCRHCICLTAGQAVEHCLVRPDRAVSLAASCTATWPLSMATGSDRPTRPLKIETKRLKTSDYRAETSKNRSVPQSSHSSLGVPFWVGGLYPLPGGAPFVVASTASSRSRGGDPGGVVVVSVCVRCDLAVDRRPARIARRHRSDRCGRVGGACTS